MEVTTENVTVSWSQSPEASSSVAHASLVRWPRAPGSVSVVTVTVADWPGPRDTMVQVTSSLSKLQGPPVEVALVTVMSGGMASVTKTPDTDEGPEFDTTTV